MTEMRMRIAGVHHNDVFGRRRLQEWLQGLKNLEKNPPSFVAVEYDENIFRIIQKQRTKFQALAAKGWPGSSQSVLKTIGNSLVYEGDLHESIFPCIETIWLDQGREIDDPTILSQYASDRLNIYKTYVKNCNLGEPKALLNATLEIMSTAAWKSFSEPLSSSERDYKFASIIVNRLQNQRSIWAIIIVGVNHASNVEGSMVNLLNNEGIDCHVSRLGYGS
jgi:hypothetical protein